MSDDRMALVQRAYQAFGSGDMATVGELLADIEWNEAAGMPYGGRYHGAAAVFANVLGPIAQDFEGFSAQPDEMLLAGDDRVLVLGHYRGTGKAGALEAPYAHLWTASDGKLTRFVQYADTYLFRQASGS